jgi:hypothetical protein
LAVRPTPSATVTTLKDRRKHRHKLRHAAARPAEVLSTALQLASRQVLAAMTSSLGG